MERMMLTLLATGLALTACLDDFVEVPELEPGEPYCMIAGGTPGTFADGTRRMILYPNRPPVGCGCSEPEHRWDADFLAELNEIAYEDCERAAQQWDFVSTECREHYELSKDCLETAVPWDFATDECRSQIEAGAWYPLVDWVGEGSGKEYLLPSDLHCAGGGYP